MSPKIDYQTKNSLVESKINQELKSFTSNSKIHKLYHDKPDIKILTRNLSTDVRHIVVKGKAAEEI